MSDDPNKPTTSARIEEQADNLGCGIGLLIAGAILILNQLGWIKGVDWVLPAVVIGLGVSFLYKAFARR